MTKTLADSDIRETPRVIGLTLLTLAVVTGTSVLMHKLGLGWVWEFIHRLPLWGGLAASVGLWGGMMLLCLRGPRIIRGAWGLLWQRGPAAIIATIRMGGLAAGALGAACGVLATIAAVLEPLRMGLALMAEPLFVALAPVLDPLRKLCRSALALTAVFDPLRDLWRSIVPPLLSRAASFYQQLQFEWTLWRAYRTEFRGRFASYREFKSALGARMYSGAEGSQDSDPPPPARDPFASACEVMGLPADGNFTEGEFKARYRALMKQVHPDIAGPNERAADVNAASMLIKKRKGWS